MLFDAIINNDLKIVKDCIKNTSSTPLDLEPSFFYGKYGELCIRKKPKTALEVAKSLNREKIVKYFNGILIKDSE